MTDASVSDARENGREDSAASGETIGVYYIAPDQFQHSPEDRRIERVALWTPEGWTPDSNGLIAKRAADPPTLESVAENPERNYFTCRPENVPGEVTVAEPSLTVEEVDFDGEIAPHPVDPPESR